MPTPRAKSFHYAVEVEADGSMTVEGAAATRLPEDWSPDHLLLAALVRCVLTSLTYHAERAELAVSGAGSARGRVTKRAEDGLYAFVEVEAELRVSLAPQPEPEAVHELLGRAERGCFVGSSLTVKPTYRWHVGESTFER